MAASSRPQPSEYNPYFGRYIGLVPEGAIADTLATQFDEFLPIYRGISEAKGAHRYAPEKWSVKQMLGHVIDTERVFAFRGFVASRGDKNHFPSFEQDDYVAAANFDARSVKDLIDELAAVRAGTVAMYKAMDDAMLMRRALVNNVQVTSRAAAWMIAGHERYHVKQLQDRYL